MREIIKDKAIVKDDWNLLKLAEGETPDSVKVGAGKHIVPLQVWLAQKTQLKSICFFREWCLASSRKLCKRFGRSQ